MLDMFMNSATLFIQGRLFQDTKAVLKMALVGILITTVLCIALSKSGLGMWASVGIAAFIGGVIQPYLFKDLKYK